MDIIRRNYLLITRMVLPYRNHSYVKNSMVVNRSTTFSYVGKLVIPAKPVNCKLSPWSSWSECRGSCNRGGQFRSRKILQKAEHGGSPCPEFKSLIKWRRCKLTKCPPEKHNGEIMLWQINQ